MSQSENDICINGLTAQTERTGQQQQVILKCIQDLQGQVTRQQEQITSLMESVLKLCSSAGGRNVTNGQKFGNNANRGPPKCFQCGEPGHFKDQCPLVSKKQGGNDKSSSGQSVSRGASAPQQFQKEGGLN